MTQHGETHQVNTKKKNNFFLFLSGPGKVGERELLLASSLLSLRERERDDTTPAGTGDASAWPPCEGDKANPVVRVLGSVWGGGEEKKTNKQPPEAYWISRSQRAVGGGQ